MFEIPGFDDMAYLEKVPTDLSGCSRARWCSPIQISLGRDLSRQEYRKSLHRATCYTCDRKFAKTHPDRRRIGRIGVNVYDDAQNPDLKGRAVWFLGIKYCSDNCKFTRAGSPSSCRVQLFRHRFPLPKRLPTDSNSAEFEAARCGHRRGSAHSESINS